MEVREATLGAWKVRLEIPDGVEPAAVHVHVHVHSESPETTAATFEGHEAELLGPGGKALESDATSARLESQRREGDARFTLILFPDDESLKGRVRQTNPWAEDLRKMIEAGS